MKHKLIPVMKPQSRLEIQQKKKAQVAKYTCEVCGLEWKTNTPQSKCLGVKVYGWGKWDLPLMTKAQLDEAGLQTGKNLPAPAGAVYREKSPNGVMWLYDSTQATPKRVISPEQKEKNKAALEAAALCPHCKIRSRVRYESYFTGHGRRRRLKSRYGWYTYCAECDHKLFLQGKRNEVREWARGALAKGFYILDTETSGLLDNGDTEILEIAIIDHLGNQVLNTRINPKHPHVNEETGANYINNIDTSTLGGCPTFEEIYDLLVWLLLGKDVVIFNADFDISFLNRMCRWRGLPPLMFGQINCAMLWYSQFVGEWSDWHGDFRWQRLPDGDHTAIGDCRATLKLVREMAGDYEGGMHVVQGVGESTSDPLLISEGSLVHEADTSWELFIPHQIPHENEA